MKTRRRHLQVSDVAVLVLCIALLLSSLAAVGRQGRMRAKEMVCLGNLRQWHAVIQNYMADHDGSFFTGLGASGYWWPVQLDEATQSWKKNRTWFCPTATRLAYDEDGQFTGSLGPFSAWGIYGQENHLGQLGPDGIAGSYSLNGYMLNTPPGYDFDAGIETDNNWTTPNVPGAEHIPLFLDALRFDVWPLHTDAPPVYELATWSGSYMAQCCINRHTDAVNCLFADGSARKVGLKKLWTLKWHRSFNTAGPWTSAGGAVPSDWPEWMRGFKDY